VCSLQGHTLFAPHGALLPHLKGANRNTKPNSRGATRRENEDAWLFENLDMECAAVGWAKARLRRVHARSVLCSLVGSLRLAHPTKQDVDGRVKPGHDVERVCAFQDDCERAYVFVPIASLTQAS